jgi:polar amino acid transport system substrate-binding protein
MRAVRLSLALALTGAAVSLVSTGVNANAATPSLASCQATVASKAYIRGTLTVATDNPVYTPWFVNNKPTNGQGYESAVAYAIAKELGVSAAHVNWVTEPFDASYAPGTKKFDFDINEISYTPDRAKAVDFSSSYYDVQQSIVALKGSKIVSAHSPAQLKSYLYGDQIGTTGLSFINTEIHPTRTPRVYNTLDEAVLALQEKQIDAIIIDTPTGQYMASAQIVDKNGKPLAVQVGQFPSVGEHYGLLLAKGSPLTGCVDAAIAALRSNGTLAALTSKWLGVYTSVPLIKP